MEEKMKGGIIIGEEVWETEESCSRQLKEKLEVIEKKGTRTKGTKMSKKEKIEKAKSQNPYTRSE